MPQDLTAQVTDAERAELERVVAALAKWPRLSHLLQYIGDKFFSGQIDQLNEYNIATEVLGRSKTVFNAGEDAIARVETHRLRKRLAAFYASEGRDHSIQVTLPAGSYVPVFIHKSEETSPDETNHTERSKLHFPRDVQPRYASITGRGKYFLLAVILLGTLGGSYLYLHSRPASTLPELKSNSAPATVSIPAQSLASFPPIRLLAGYAGPPRTDSAGITWSADQYFTGGGSWQGPPRAIAKTSDPFLFGHFRTGDFSYAIPLKPGLYELHLFFSTATPSSEGMSTFNISVNGEDLLGLFDINSDALGENIADERIFRDVSPGKDGFLRIGVTGVTGTGTLNALEILPGNRHAQLPIRLIMQTTSFTDRNGRFWRPDNYFMNGRLRVAAQVQPLRDASDPDLFSGERFGHFTYAIPVDTRDRYTLVLHFAELYFGTGEPGNGGVGSRLFKVMCNGETLLDNFDIYKEVGSLHEITRTFRHLKSSPQGKLNLTFEPIANNATISGIEVLDESQ